MIAIVDAGPLFAALDYDDKDHARSLSVLERPDLDLVIPALVVAEVCHFAERDLTPAAEAGFLRELADYDVQAPLPEEWPMIADLVERYGNFPLGGTDASIVVLAERLATNLIVTLDRRHFGALRMTDGRPFLILPD